LPRETFNGDEMSELTSNPDELPVKATSDLSDLLGADEKTVTAYWDASLDCECPGCKKDVDLLEYADFWDGRNDLEIAQQAEGIEVVCPKCGREFTVNTVW
jgi:hypothetical protein